MAEGDGYAPTPYSEYLSFGAKSQVIQQHSYFLQQLKTEQVPVFKN